MIPTTPASPKALIKSTKLPRTAPTNGTSIPNTTPAGENEDCGWPDRRASPEKTKKIEEVDLRLEDGGRGALRKKKQKKKRTKKKKKASRTKRR